MADNDFTSTAHSKRRKTPDDYYALAVQRGFEWLGPEVSSVQVKTGWRCSQGHDWQAPYTNIRGGSGCPGCAQRGQQAHPAAQYRDLAAKRGFEWLGPMVADTKTKTTWRCLHGHEWQASYASVRMNNCPHCSGRAPKIEADYQALAAQRGFQWLGPMVADTKTKTTWRCLHGHEWQTTFGEIRSNKGCPFCAGLKRKIPEDYYALAAKYGIEWLGPVVSNSATKTGWRCAQGHEWQTTYGNIRSGSGCPYCAGNIPKTPADYLTLAAQRGFEWLGPVVSSSKIDTVWRCQQGHEWKARYNTILNGHGCPHCLNTVNSRYISKPQIAIHGLLGGELNYRVGRYCVDIALFIGEVKVAIEYDCKYWHDPARDRRRDGWLLDRDWHVLHIRSANLIPTLEQLQEGIFLLLAGKIWHEIVLSDW